MKYPKALFFSVVAASVFFSCKKEDNFVPEKYADETILFPEELGEPDGLMMAVRDMVGIDLTGKQEIPVDLALAYFNPSGYVEVGEVKLNNKLLDLTSANQYVSNLENISFELNGSTQNRWSIAGDNGFETFNKVLTVRMPAKIVFDAAPAVIALNQQITLKVESLPNHAQAIIWQLKDVDGNFIQKETTTNELTLTASELSRLSAGRNSLLKVAAYSMEKWTNSGKQYVFVNQTVETATVELK